MYKYKVSIIMAVYKVEEFLREAIDSVIEQDIGFQNIQLILVDDGSPDGSPAICDEYAARYPDNIVVIHKENGGVSTARNAGIERVEGQFVNFLDSDDKLSPNAVREIYNFFMDHLEETDVVGFPLKFFDGVQGDHILNYKFSKGARVIDLDREWQNPQLSMSSAFVKAECLRQYRFDMRLAYAEDAQFMQKLLAPKAALGVVPKAIYWYRRRNTGEASALQTSVRRKAWYLPCMRYFHQEIIAFYMERYGYLPRFIQYTLMYDMQWRISQRDIPEDILEPEEKTEYLDMVRWVLSHIDNEVINTQRNIYRERKLYAMLLKHGKMPELDVRDSDICMRYDGNVWFKVSMFPMKLEFMELKKDHCVVEGVLSVLPVGIDDYSVYAAVNGEMYEAQMCGSRYPARSLGEYVQMHHTFRVRIPLQPGKQHKIRFYCKAGDTMTAMSEIRYGNFFPVAKSYQNEYYTKVGWVLRTWKKGISLEAETAEAVKAYEKAFRRELWKKNGPADRKAMLFRCFIKFLKWFKKKPLWLISDRVMKAGDNGEALFRYMRENHSEIDARFVISDKSPDYEKMRKVGPVLKTDSYLQKACLLLSDCIISSSAEVEVYNPFSKYMNAYRGMLADTKFVFLQHGVTKDDLSQWLGRFNKNLAGLVAAAKPEADAFVSGDYEYTEKQVWLTGFPRFDRLYRDEQKCITIMPTWRKNLTVGWDRNTDRWTLVPNVEKSEYILFLNNLLNDPRLLEAAKRYGYRLAFLPHPNLQNNLELFTHNGSVEILGREMEYRDIYAKSDLIVTDYSSVVFDFAYLRKPVLYAQFDVDSFFAGEHTYSKGYFDYERDGFGEVEYDLDGTVERIIEYMANGCMLKEKYRQRIDRFFAFDDQNNSHRVYEKIMELQEH